MSEIKTPAHLSKALRSMIDRRQLLGVHDAEEQTPEDNGAEVLLLHLEGGRQILVTMACVGTWGRRE